MKHLHAAIIAMLALLSMVAGLAAAQTSPGTTAPLNRIVFQINEDDPRKWNTVLANINNVQEELGKVEVAVVVIGPALGMIKFDALTATKVQDAIAAGARFVACGNSMKAQQLTRDDMIDHIDYARAGYVELMRLQQGGWTYLRP